MSDGQRAPAAPVVSIVIPNWNGAALLPDCFAALAAQTLRGAEIVLVDNGSTDDSLARAAALAGQFGLALVPVPLPENRGFAAATNAGLARAAAPYVFCLNNDAAPAPDCLEALVGALEGAPPGFGFCAPRLVLWDAPERIDTAGHGFTIAGAGFARHRWAPASGDALAPGEVFGACAAAALYRREVLLARGGFDEDFFCYYEDLDLDARLQLAGQRCLYVPQAVVRHRISATAGGSRSAFIVEYSSRNQEWLYLKVMPGPLFWLCLPVHLCYGFLRGAAYLVKGQGGAYLRGKLRALWGWRAMWRKRCAIQAERALSSAAFLQQLDRRWLRRHFLDHTRWGRGGAS